MPKSLRHHSHHIDKSLRRRLYLYFGISLILIGILIYNIARGALRIDYGAIGLLAGIGIGIITSRMFHTSWNKDAKKVISRFDTFGIGILVLYIVFELLRERIVGYFTHDVQVGTVGFAVLAGIMFGRVIGTRGKIVEILKEQKIFM
ncbi:MAG: hypothetical protein Q8Q49_00525 [bacterium]|nr:hypothetical protein [bacterium]